MLENLSDWGKSRELHFLVIYILLQPAISFRAPSGRIEDHKHALVNIKRRWKFSGNNKLASYLQITGFIPFPKIPGSRESMKTTSSGKISLGENWYSSPVLLPAKFSIILTRSLTWMDHGF